MTSRSTDGATDALPRTARVGYGAAEMGISGVEVLIRIGLLIFYTDVVGLEPALAGYAVALGVVWDAITDPLMGRISDRTRGRFGRRRPWILIGALALAVCVVVLFSVPPVQSQSGKFAVLLLAYMATNTAMTVIAVPHSALAGDLVAAGPVRVELFGWRLLFANLGLLLGTALPGLVLMDAAGAGSVAERAGADRLTAVVLGALTVLTAAITLYATRGRDVAADASRHSVDFRTALRSVLTNPVLWPLLGAYLVASIGVNINSALALYYYRYRLLLEEQDTRAIIAVFMLIFCLSIPFWLRVARSTGKKTAVIVGALSLGAMSCVVYLLFPPGNPYWPLIACVIGGVAIGSVVLLEAMLADVVDYDRLRSGESRFGLYFGVWKMSAKASRAIAIALAGNLLSLIGFEPNAEQTADTALGIAIMFGPGVGVAFILAALILCWHPLDEARHARVLSAIRRREERRQRVRDPAR